MYDTVNKYLPKERVVNTDLLSEIPCYLTNVKEVYCQTTDTVSIRGNLKNYRISVNKEGVFLTGSICKYKLGDNIQTLDLIKTKEAITMLSDELHLPIHEANITRIDLAKNLQMNYEVPFYYPFLGEASRYNRLEQNNGIYYRNGLKEMLFYGKIYEQELKGVPIPEPLRESNLLRYELRFKSHLKQQFKLSEVKASILYNEKFYLGISNRWKAEYLKIKKHKLFELEPKSLNNVKDFEKLIYLNGIKAIGGEVAILQMIEQAKTKGVFKNKMQVKRCKDKVKSICNTPQLSFESNAIKELDEKVNEDFTSYTK